MQEAETSMNRLVDLVESLVSSNTDLQIRIDALAIDHASLSPPPPAEFVSNTYEADLSTSRVYRKLRPRDSIWSISDSQRGSMALSAFSDLTLGNISIVSVLCLPLWSTDLSNAEHYRFGRDGLNLTMEDLRTRYPEIDFPDAEDEVPVDAGSPMHENNPTTLDNPEVLFQAASLFEFSLANKSEAGIPYLTYLPGEVCYAHWLCTELC
jgi:hypothetical protein